MLHSHRHEQHGKGRSGEYSVSEDMGPMTTIQVIDPALYDSLSGTKLSLTAIIGQRTGQRSMHCYRGGQSHPFNAISDRQTASVLNSSLKIHLTDSFLRRTTR